MTFLNVDDNFPEHLKVDPLSDGAFRLHVSAMCYCARQQTDGRVPESKLSRLTPRFRRSWVDELVDQRLWVPVAGGYEIHDYLDWNRSRAQIEADKERLRKVRSAAGRKGAEARWHKG